MISVGALFLGVLNIAIVVALLLLLGLLIVWLIRAFGWPTPDAQVQKVYLLLVLLIAIYMLVALLLGMPSVSVLPFR